MGRFEGICCVRNPIGRMDSENHGLDFTSEDLIRKEKYKEVQGRIGELNRVDEIENHLRGVALYDVLIDVAVYNVARKWEENVEECYE